MAPTIIYDGEVYYLINRAHISEVIINDNVYPVHHTAKLYAKSPKNSGSMYGMDEILLEIDGRAVYTGKAKWAYISRGLSNGVNHPCKDVKIEIPKEIVLIICT